MSNPFAGKFYGNVCSSCLEYGVASCGTHKHLAKDEQERDTQTGRIDRILRSGPESFEDAELARNLFCEYVQRLLTETDRARLEALSEEVRRWALIIPLCRPWLDAEVERIKREPPPVLYYELTKLAARDDVAEVVKAADGFATVTFTRAAKEDTKP